MAPSSIKNEISSIKAFIADKLPGVQFNLEYREKDVIKPKVAVIEMENRVSTVETSYHYRIDSLVQITYYDSSKLRCMQAMEEVVRKLNDEQVIPILGSDRFIKFDAPTVTKAHETQTPDVCVIACMLRIVTREPIKQREYDLIMDININN